MGMRKNMVKSITIHVTLTRPFMKTNYFLLAVTIKLCPGDTRPYVRAWKASKRVEDPRQRNVC